MILDTRRKKMEKENNIKDKLILCINKKLTRKETAIELKLSEDRISFLVSKYHLISNFNKTRKEKTEQKILYLISQEKHSVSEISKLSGISTTTIRRCLKKHNIKLEKNKRLHKLTLTEYNKIIEKLKTKNITLSAIAKEFHISKQYVWEIKNHTQ